jgi:AraC family transcriptional activator of tynA and feaB
MMAHVAEHFRIVDATFTPHHTANAPAAQARKKRDTFLLSIQHDGDVEVAQDGRSTRIRPRDFFLIDTARPFTIETGDMRCLSLYFSGERLRAVMPDIDAFTATAISGKPGSGAFFRAALTGLYRNAGAMDDASARNVAESIPHLLAAALRSIVPDLAVARACSERVYVEQIRSFALERLADPDLSCEMIAKGVALSVRHVHELFSRQHETLMKWVWNQRLARARADLSTPARRDRSIGDIAFACGFIDSAHFSRSFKGAFGASPRAFRQARANLP